MLDDNDNIIPEDAIKLVLFGENYQVLFEESSMPMWILDLPNLNFLVVNHAAIKHYGYTREEFLCMTIFDIRSQAEKERLLEEIHQSNFFSSQKQQWKHIKKNGVEINVEIAAQDILFNGKRARLISCFDITATLEQQIQIQALNQLLLDSESKYRSVFDSALQAIVLAKFQTDWKIVEANPAAMELFGYNASEFQQLRRDDLLDANAKDYSGALEEREKLGRVTGEYIGIRKDGKRFNCQFDSVLFRDQSGILWSSTMFSDITYRIESQKKQIRDKQILNQAEELAAIGSAEVNVLDGSRLWSDGFYRLLGFEPRAIEPRMSVFLEQLHPDDFNRYLSWTKQIITEGIPESSIEVKVKRRDGMLRIFLINSRLEFNQEGKVVKLFGVIQDITEKKQIAIDLELSKKEIQKDKALLESIINSPKDIFIVAFDNEYKVTAFTQGYKTHLKERFGIDLNLGMNILDSSPPHLRDLAKKQFDRALAGEYFMMSRPLEIQSGVWRHYENNFAPIIGNNGHIEGFTVFVHDVDDLKRIERENRLNEMRYSALFSGSSDAIIIAEIESKQIVDLNQKASKLLGYDKEALIGKEIGAIHPEEIMDQVRLIFQKFTEGVPHDGGVESFVLNKNGSWIPVSIFAGVVFNIEDKSYSATYYKDQTNVKETETKLRNISDLLNRAEGIAHVGSVEVDLINGSRIWSDEFFRILGLDANSVKPDKSIFTNMIHPEDRQGYEDWYRVSIRNKGMLQPIEIRIVRNDGKYRNLFISGMTYDNDAGILVKHIGVIRDITEQKRILLNLEKQNAQLKEIAWTQSHVVRAPLARLIGLVQMFKKNMVTPDKEANMIDYILKSANELDKVIHDITNKTVSVEQKNENDIQI